MQQEQANISTPNIQEQSSVIALILQRFRLRAWRRVAWLREVWQKTTPENKTLGAYHQEVDRILLEVDHPSAESEWYKKTEAQQAFNEDVQTIETVLAEDKHSRFFLIKEIFGLNQVEADLLQACLVVALEPQLGRVCAYLQDQMNRPYITSELVARLYGYGTTIRLSPESPLKTWRLIKEDIVDIGQPTHISIDPFIRDWLIGRSELDENLVGIAHIHLPKTPIPAWPVAETLKVLEGHLQAAPPQRVRMKVMGVPGSGRKTFAAVLAEQLNMPLLVLETGRVTPVQWEAFCTYAYRQAYLDRCALGWAGKHLSERHWPANLPPFQVQFAIVEPEQELAPIPTVTDHQVIMPNLNLEETQALWQQMLPETSRWEKNKVEKLLHKYHFSVGQIANFAKTAVKTPEEIEAHLKKQSHNFLGKLAQPLNTTFRWEDLVLKDHLKAQLQDFVYEATQRRSIWERPGMMRLFPQGKGLFALFSGAPGTGKTMAAQVIAAELELPLFRIDLSSVVSKYVGETSKNLQRIFSQAKNKNVVMLFDEADALFGKRTDVKDAHDRFANTDTNYLLQAIEQFPGIGILTSNKKANIDHGFIRRLRYVLDFPFPDKIQRIQIWRQLIAEMTDADRLKQLENAIDGIAENLELTGAQIKLSILSATIMAQREKEQLQLKHLIQGIEREFMKEGRGISSDMKKALWRPLSSNHFKGPLTNGL
ncbi:MAG: ATP-binding protein [Chitinophagales bacterium]|nr:ATP-binding protein [Chitinophagales bacterium]